MLNVPPLHIMIFLLGTIGVGFIFTVSVKLAPGHPPEEGVTVYVATWEVFVVLTNVPVMVVWAVPVAPPVNPVPVGIGQL